MSTIACDAPHSTLDEPAWLSARRPPSTPSVVAACPGSLGHAFQFGDRRASQSVAGNPARSGPGNRGQEWDYATPAERQETQEWNAEHGYCSHGIEFGYCPAGCGS
jgi:hypothetical protein